MATAPQFAVTPRISSVSIATADAGGTGASYAAPTTAGTLIAGVSTGTRIAEVVVKLAQTSAASVIRLWLYDGTNYFLFDEFTVAAATGSTTVQQTRVSTTYNNLILPNASWSLRVSTSVAQTTHVTALGADL
jgi:hypothetical protein